ncbi:MAG TPA: GNAT family N-acetyltransferase [Thermotogota bacterium]|nr:GNAT family N-acetyltransferase [Thermotogota bacterium]HPJ88666.1 GNAT family N-acetyltransferase [Thermotogota bacterium]HPR95796.1 GNAT family N-acetyltransferase [Thermotogota bacterium]
MIRPFKKSDTVAVADLVYETFKKYNGDAYFTDGAVEKTLDNFDTKNHTEDELYEIIGKPEIFYVYEIDGEIVGALRGNLNKLNSLFVSGNHHGNGIGQKLVKAFEEEVIKRGSEYVELTASLFAVNFYLKQGYEKTSDIVDFEGLKVYRMKKYL